MLFNLEKHIFDFSHTFIYVYKRLLFALKEESKLKLKKGPLFKKIINNFDFQQKMNK